MKNLKKINTVPELEQIIADEVEKKKSKTKPTLTVSAGTCGRARGSMNVIKSLEKVIRKENLGDKVQIKVTGCHGFCAAFCGGADRMQSSQR